MPSKKSYFTPSTNLADDIGNKGILDNVIVTNQVISTIKLFSQDLETSNNDAVSIVGPYGSGKSTTALVLYHFLTNSLPKIIVSELRKNSINPLKKPYKTKEIKIVVGQKTSLEQSLKRNLKIRSPLVNHIKEKIINRGQRLVLIIDEFGKYLEYSSDDPKNGDVYILQQLAELASRSNGMFTLVTIRHQSIMGYFSGLKGSFLNEWKKIQGRFYDIVHSNTIEDTFSLIAPHIKKWSSKDHPRSSGIARILKNNPAIGDLSKIDVIRNSYPFHSFTILILISAYKRFAQNERSVFTFLNTNEKFSIKDYISKSTNGFYRLCDFYDYIYHNLSHYLLESPFYQDWNKIEIALRDLKSSKNAALTQNYDQVQDLIKTIGMLDLFGNDVGLKADENILCASLYNNTTKKNLVQASLLIHGLQDENIITYNTFQGGSYHLWHGAHTNINELINKTIEEQKGTIDIAKHLERLSPNDPIIAKKHLIKKGSFRSIELRYQSIDELDSRSETLYDGVIYLFIALNKSQKDKITEKLISFNFDELEKALVLVITPILESYIRQYIAASYLEQNNEQLKSDKIGRDELILTKYHLSQNIDSMVRNHSIMNVKMFWLKSGTLHSMNYKKLSTEYINDWMEFVYDATPIIKNELVNVVKPSPSAMVGVKRLLGQMLKYSHLPNFGIESNGPEKSIYLNVIQNTGIHRKTGNKSELTRPYDTGLVRLWDAWDEMIQSTRDDNDRISIAKLISKASAPPFGLKHGLAHLLSIIKVFSDLGQISVYHKRHMEQEFMYLAKIEKDTIELLTKRPENFEVKFVDSKIHQSLFSELYHFLNQDQKDITTLLDVARSIIDKVSILRERTIKTRKGISKQAQDFIREVRDARSPEDLIYVKIPESLGLESITSKKCVSTEKYVNNLQSIFDEIHHFEENIFPSIKEQIIGVWELGISANSTISDTKAVLSKKVNKLVLNWIFDEKVKEFVKRVLDDERNGGAWLESVSSHLVGKLPDKWSDDDIPVFIDQLRFMKIQYEEAEYLYNENRAVEQKQDIDTKQIEDEFDKLARKLKLSDVEKQLALVRLYRKYVRSEEKN